jgi:hypothetical protein
MSSLGEIGPAPSGLHCRRCWCAVRDVCPSRSATRVGTVSFLPSVSSPPSAPRRAVVSDGQESKGVSLPHSLSRLQDGCRCTTSLRLLTPPRARAFPLLSPARRFSARLLTKTGISQVGLARSVAAGRVVTSASGSVSSSRNPLESRRTRAQPPTTRVRCVPTACWSFCDGTSNSDGDHSARNLKTNLQNSKLHRSCPIETPKTPTSVTALREEAGVPRQEWWKTYSLY